MKAALAIALVLALAACERHAGRLLDSRTISSQGVDFLVQLYSIAHYGPEREAVFWCRTAKSVHVGSLTWAKRTHLQIESDDWLFLSGEIKRLWAPVASRAFSEHRLGELGICLRLNPEYLATADAFDVCSADRGKTWYARLASGALGPPGADDEHYSDTLRAALNYCAGERRPQAGQPDCAWHE